MLLALAVAACLLGACADSSDIPGDLNLPEISGEPIQTNLTSKEDKVFRPFENPEVPGNFEYRRLAAYEATVLIVLKRDNINDGFGKPVPLDMLLAWGPFADTSLLEQFNLKLHKRHYSWRTDVSSLNGQSVYRLADNLANTHFIAANPEVFNELRKIPEGSTIRFSGYLVDVRNTENNGLMKSSTKRSDSGWGACEVIEVTHFEVIRETD